MARRCNIQHATYRGAVCGYSSSRYCAARINADCANLQLSDDALIEVRTEYISFDDRRNNSISPPHWPPEAPRSRVSCDVAVAAAADWLSILMQRRMLSHCWLHFLMWLKPTGRVSHALA